MNGSETYIKGLRDGKESHLHHFICKYGKSLRFFAYTLIRNKEAAEEIVSDVFFKLWTRRESFTSAEKVKAFLYIATRNACYDYLDSPKNRVRFDIDIADQLEYPQKDLLAQIIEVELVDMVYQEINKLPVQQAEVFRMSFFDGMSTNEISERLGITHNAIFLARSRALAKLRLVFKDKQVVWCLLLSCWLNYPG